MKARSLLSANEIAELHEWLDRRLDRIGVQSQPEVAVKLTELCSKPDAQVQEYAKVIKTDHALSGRVLKLANSAFFAQRSAVTNVDRACVVLGLERLKSVALGFYLARSSAGGDKDLSRRIWGHSLLRACLASQLARLGAPGYSAEAFVIGLMLDCGIPLVARIAGERYGPIVEGNPSPGRVYTREFERLECTHVDVVAVLAKRWKLPELLAKPLEQHHSKPPEPPRDDATGRLHRLAYVVGLLELDDRAALSTTPPAPLSTKTKGITTAQRLLGLSDEQVAGAIGATLTEYQLTSDMFRDFADGMPDVEAVLERVQLTLGTMLEDRVTADLSKEVASAPMRLRVGGMLVELVRDAQGQPLAYLFDSSGARMLAHRLAPEIDTPRALCAALGLESVSPAELDALAGAIRRLAA